MNRVDRFLFQLLCIITCSFKQQACPNLHGQLNCTCFKLHSFSSTCNGFGRDSSEGASEREKNKTAGGFAVALLVVACCVTDCARSVQMDRFIPARSAMDLDVANFNLLKENNGQVNSTETTSSPKVCSLQAVTFRATSTCCQCILCNVLCRWSTRSAWLRALVQRKLHEFLHSSTR